MADGPGGRGERKLNWGAVSDADEPGPAGERWPEDATGETSLLDLCTPVFALASFLPASADQPQPEYETVRMRVLEELRRLEAEAAQHGIDPADAKEAAYALCLYIDEMVNQSGWTGRQRWATEPLHIMVQGDPAGGVHFFDKLQGFSPRQSDVKAVYLACLSMGFRGKYAEYSHAEQATEVMRLRQEVLAGIGATSLETRNQLFPEAYRPARPIQVDVPAGPARWKVISIATCGAALTLVALMYVHARIQERGAKQAFDEALNALQETYTQVNREQLDRRGRR